MPETPNERRLRRERELYEAHGLNMPIQSPGEPEPTTPTTGAEIRRRMSMSPSAPGEVTEVPDSTTSYRFDSLGNIVPVEPPVQPPLQRNITLNMSQEDYIHLMLVLSFASVTMAYDLLNNELGTSEHRFLYDKIQQFMWSMQTKAGGLERQHARELNPISRNSIAYDLTNSLDFRAQSMYDAAFERDNSGSDEVEDDR